MAIFANDIHYAARQLRKSPGFATTAILTLALGIGATTAIFTLVYQIMLRSMPVAHPEQLYKMGKNNCEGCVLTGMQDDWSVFSSDFYRYLMTQVPENLNVAAVQSSTTTVSAHRFNEATAAQPIDLHFISGNYFSVMGVKPHLGRMLSPKDDYEGAPPTAVISYTLWQTKFAADPKLLGSTLLLSKHPVTIVGIAARNFLGERNMQDAPGVWLPLALEPTFDTERPLARYPTFSWLNLILRVPNAGQVSQVQQAVKGALHQWLVANRGLFPRMTSAAFAHQTTALVPASGGLNDLRDQYEKSLKLLVLIVGFVLLIACANLANLLLVRGVARQQELGIRVVLGASRARLIRQVMTEAILLSLFGGAAAIVVAFAATRGIIFLAMRGAESTPLSALPSLPVLGFALVVSLLTGALFGMAPAWFTSHINPSESLRGANRSTINTSASPQKMLVILQVALSLVLLSTAGLLITSLRNLEHQDFGFQSSKRLLVFTDLQAAGYSYDRLAGFYRRLDDTLSNLTTIEKFAYATYAPMTSNNWSGTVFLRNDSSSPRSSGALYDAVSPNFFSALGIDIQQGRPITGQDTATSRHVAVVNQAFVSKFLKGTQPIGEHFGPSQMMQDEFEIVGVAADVKNDNPDKHVPPTYYTSIAQSTIYPDHESTANENSAHYASNLIIYYRGDPSAAAASVRRTLNKLDPEIPILKMLPYSDQLSIDFDQEELVTRLTTLLSLLALLLASVGLYGVTAYAVARRRHEIGIRMALGASRSDILKMIIRGALMQVLVGFAVGLPICFVVAQLLRHTLYQLSIFEPSTLLAAAGLLLVSAFAASFVPARRAASADPTAAFRTD